MRSLEWIVCIDGQLILSTNPCFNSIRSEKSKERTVLWVKNATIILLVLFLSSTISLVAATDVTWTFYLIDASTLQPYTGAATLEIRGNYVNIDYSLPNGSGIIYASTGYALGYNVRAAGYLSYPSPTSIIPSSDQTFYVYLSSATPFANYGYTAPFSSYTISSNFGWRSWASAGYSYYNNFNKHSGVDIPKSVGTEISSISDVYATDFSSGYNASEGFYVHVQPSSSYTIRYMHMNQQFGTTGVTSVNQGDCIGYVGNSGNSTGAHLHIDISYNGAYYDPLAFFG